MKQKAKISIIIGLVLASTTLANFAFAQTPPPTVATVTKESLLAAQANPEACRTFRKEVQKVWQNQAKAIWSAEMIPGDETFTIFTACSIVPGTYADYLDAALTQPSGADPNGLGLYGTTGDIPKQFIDLQNQIASGKGATSTDVAEAIKKADQAKQDSGWLSTIFGEVLVVVFGIINSVLAGIAAMAGGIFTSAIYPILHITIMPTIVNVGWTIIRDICNMFFILIFIIMALATILHLGDEYNYKRLLPKLIIFALLVNFSLIISVTIMNAVNFLAAAFWSGPNVDLWHLFAKMIKIINPVGDFNVVWTGGTPAALALGLGRLLFIVVATVVFIALALLFVIRLVGLYVLIIFSPIAYVGRILPATKKYADEWWNHFIKYLIWAPVALFMLRLTMLVVDNDSQFNFSGGGNHDSSFVFFILTAFMAAALLVAKKAGMVGGDMIVNGVQKGAKSLGKLGYGVTDRKLASWSGKGGVRGALSNLSVGAWKRGREMAIKQKEEAAYTESAGRKADLYNKVFGGPRDFGRLGQYQRIAQEKKRLDNIVDKDELTAKTKKAIDDGEMEMALGGMMKLAAQGDINEITSAMGKPGNAEGLQAVFKDMVDRSGNQDLYRIGAEISKTAEGAGHWNFAGAFQRNKDGSFSARKEEERRQYVNIQRAKNSDQVNIRNINRLGAGFVETTGKNAAGEDVWYVDKIDSHGMDYAARIKNINEWRGNGNKNLKANVALSGSEEWLQANPEAWGVAANEYAALKLEADKDPTGQAGKRFEEFKKSVAAPNPEREYDDSRITDPKYKGRTVNVEQARRFFEANGKEFKKKIEEGKDKDAAERYGDLYKFAYPGGTPSGGAGTPPSGTGSTSTGTPGGTGTPPGGGGTGPSFTAAAAAGAAASAAASGGGPATGHGPIPRETTTAEGPDYSAAAAAARPVGRGSTAAASAAGAAAGAATARAAMPPVAHIEIAEEVIRQANVPAAAHGTITEVARGVSSGEMDMNMLTTQLRSLNTTAQQMSEAINSMAKGVANLKTGTLSDSLLNKTGVGDMSGLKNAIRNAIETGLKNNARIGEKIMQDGIVNSVKSYAPSVDPGLATEIAQEANKTS